MSKLWKWWAKWYREQFLLMAAQADWLGRRLEVADLPRSHSVGNGSVTVLVIDASLDTFK